MAFLCFPGTIHKLDLLIHNTVLPWMLLSWQLHTQSVNSINLIVSNPQLSLKSHLKQHRQQDLSFLHTFIFHMQFKECRKLLKWLHLRLMLCFPNETLGAYLDCRIHHIATTVLEGCPIRDEILMKEIS